MHTCFVFTSWEAATPHFILSHPLGIPQALMLEYPIHGSFHSFLVAKRKGVLSGDNQYWPGWTQRHIERNVAEVTIMRVVRGYEYES